MDEPVLAILLSLLDLRIYNVDIPPSFRFHDYVSSIPGIGGMS